MVRLSKLHSEFLLASEVRNVICYFSVLVPLLCFFRNLTWRLLSHSVVDFPQGKIQLWAARLFDSFIMLLPQNNIIVLSSFLDKRSVGFRGWCEGAFSSSLSNLHAQVVRAQWGLNEHLLKLQEHAATSSSLFLQLGHRIILSLFSLPFPSGIPWPCTWKLCSLTTLSWENQESHRSGEWRGSAAWPSRSPSPLLELRSHT